MKAGLPFNQIYDIINKSYLICNQLIKRFHYFCINNESDDVNTPHLTNIHFD